MIKPDLELHEWLDQKGVIRPLRRSKIREIGGVSIISKGLSEAGYDLELGDVLTIPKAPNPVKHFFSKWIKAWRLTLDPFNPVEMVEVELKRDEHGRYYYDLPPNSFCLGASYEYLNIPKDSIGICFGKSTYARDGKGMPMTPLEPGWCGHVTIEIANFTRYWSRVYIGMGICQVLFLPLTGEVARAYEGGYQNQGKDPVVSMVVS